MIVMAYDYFRNHPLVRHLALLAITALLVLSLTRITYKEDISDFLPIGSDDHRALSIYQQISGADRIVVLFDNPGDADLTVSAIEAFAVSLERRDTLGMASDVMMNFDVESVSEVASFVYSNIPYFLSDADYRRIDSLLAIPDYTAQQLARNKESLMFPSSGMLSEFISSDPLNLFTPAAMRLMQRQNQSKFEMYDGYVFTPDMAKAIVLVRSPYGNSETEHNSQLMELLNAAIADMHADYPQVTAHLTGGPAIAVGNASRIRHDSILSVSISALLILLLLMYSLRSGRNILLVALSIAWGWLFAVGAIAVINSSVSIIVIGISSVIIGIAVNYPLHLVDHIRHQNNVRQALKDIVVPLVVGNITTVGAFLALVPLDSVALRDLGLFASFLLVGTILFVMLFLPHMVKVSTNRRFRNHFLESIAEIKLDTKGWVVAAIAIATLVLGWFSLNTKFDSNIANINYMTEEQRNDMRYMQQLLAADSTLSKTTVYVVSEGRDFDEALNCERIYADSLAMLARRDRTVTVETAAPFVTLRTGQAFRLRNWHRFVEQYDSLFSIVLPREAAKAGFSADAFADFDSILAGDYQPRKFDHFEPLTASVLASHFCTNADSSMVYVVDRVEVDPADVKRIEQMYPGSFDVVSMNSAIADRLSDQFNYIGWACSIIVFMFLWFSFGRIELAILSFIPMAVSWIWILGIMAAMDIKFNIVNIILATFIFGQGDDYTIFMTEGCQYEYARRRPMLASYKNSIILSALIMLVGIGTLIFAKHPALHSLAQVTIVGMVCVVLMAYVLPPLIFRWMVAQRGRYRKRPLTLGSLVRTWYCAAVWLSALMAGYVLGFVMFVVLKPTDARKSAFHRVVTAVHRWCISIMPGVKFDFRNPNGISFDRPCVVACNHQSMLDPMCLMALSSKIVIVANRRSSMNPVIRIMFRWLDFYTIRDNEFEADLPLFASLVSRGYSIAVFPEGERNPNSNILRFHKGVFFLAERLRLDIVTVYLHGLNDVMPIRSFASNAGQVTVVVGERIAHDSPLVGLDYSETTRRVHRHFVDEYALLKRSIETSHYHRALVLSRYLYKGAEVYHSVRRNMRRNNDFADVVDYLPASATHVVVSDSGHGEASLLLALVNPLVEVTSVISDSDRRAVARYSAAGLVHNLNFVERLSKKQPESIYFSL